MVFKVQTGLWLVPGRQGEGHRRWLLGPRLCFWLPGQSMRVNWTAQGGRVAAADKLREE